MASWSGLPPQVRGALEIAAGDGEAVGLTPAGAGSTRLQALYLPHISAYPRRCGEHRELHGIWGGVLGLPPQVRGARPGPRRSSPSTGLTPAGAGSTASPTSTLLGDRAYPRRCGEHVQYRWSLPTLVGLPPQVRGARTSPDEWLVIGRLTPAGAGSTAPRARSTTITPAYPRRCGEHENAGGVALEGSGLPPQVRGARHMRPHGAARRRLTPAGAGSTRSDASSS